MYSKKASVVCQWIRDGIVVKTAIAYVKLRTPIFRLLMTAAFFTAAAQVVRAVKVNVNANHCEYDL